MWPANKKALRQLGRELCFLLLHVKAFELEFLLPSLLELGKQALGWLGHERLVLATAARPAGRLCQ